LANAARKIAEDVLDAGPPALSIDESQLRKYRIETLADDLRDATTDDEVLVLGSQLLEQLSDFILRAAGNWSAQDDICCQRF